MSLSQPPAVYALLAISRLVLAGIMLAYGVQKLRAPEGFSRTANTLLPQKRSQQAVRLLVPPADLLAMCGLLFAQGGQAQTQGPLLVIEVLFGLAVILLAVRKTPAAKQAAAAGAVSRPEAGLRGRRWLLGVGTRGLGMLLVAPFALAAGQASQALAFVCTCACPGPSYYIWTDCVCGVKELYYVEVTVCCQLLAEICDEWGHGVLIADC